MNETAMKSSFYALFFGFIFYSNAVLAQSPGDPDNSFGTNGKLILPAGTANAFSRSITIQNDRKLILAAILNNGQDTDFGVVRITQDGAPDSSWNEDGIAQLNFNAKSDIPEAVAVDQQDRIIVAGYTDNGNDFDFAVARFTSAGNPDSTFHGDGKANYPLGFTSFCKSALIQPDNKIVIAGYGIDPASAFNVFVLMRINENGTLDQTFDGDGIVKTDMLIGSAVANAITLQPDGKIIAAGQVFNEATFFWEIGVARYNSDGSLDETWDEDGVAFTPEPNVNFTINAVAIQPDKKVVVGGYSGTAPSNNLYSLARYDSKGLLDDDFGVGGVVRNSYGAEDNQITSLAIQPDGKILIAGSSLSGNADRFVLSRLDEAGNPDSAFGNNGVVIEPIGQNSGIKTIALQDDGKLVAAGESFDGSRFNLVIGRYETGIVTSIGDNTRETVELSLFPNPAQDHVTLIFPSTFKEIKQLSLFDELGRNIFSVEPAFVNVNEVNFSIPGNLTNGSYWIKARNDNQYAVAKLLIIR